MPYIPISSFWTEKKPKKKPKGWKAESLRHALARKRIKTGKGKVKEYRYKSMKRAEKVAEGLDKSGFDTKIEQKGDHFYIMYKKRPKQTLEEKYFEHNLLARYIWLGGAFTGLIAGVLGGALLGGSGVLVVPPMWLGGVVGGEVALKVYKHLPFIKKKTKKGVPPAIQKKFMGWGKKLMKRWQKTKLARKIEEIGDIEVKPPKGLMLSGEILYGLPIEWQRRSEMKKYGYTRLPRVLPTKEEFRKAIGLKAKKMRETELKPKEDKIITRKKSWFEVLKT